MPQVRYYWLHRLLAIGLLPWGLLVLLFPLRRCRGCRRSYDAAPESAAVG
jgi:hypothetical protein